MNVETPVTTDESTPETMPVATAEARDGKRMIYGGFEPLLDV